MSLMWKTKLRTWYTAQLVDVFHNIFPTRFKVGKERDTIRDGLEVIDGQFYPHRMRNGKKVQHGVR